MLVKTGDNKLVNLPLWNGLFTLLTLAWAVYDVNKVGELNWFFVLLVPSFAGISLWSLRFVSLENGVLKARSLFSSEEFDLKTTYSSWRRYSRGGSGIQLETGERTFQIGEAITQGAREKALVLVEETFGVRQLMHMSPDEHIESENEDDSVW